MIRRRTVFLMAIPIALAGVLAWSAVDNRLTEDDRLFVARILDEGGVSPPPPQRTFEDEIRFIGGVQRAVTAVSEPFIGIPYGRSREPRDLYEAGGGLCYDRSRTIEKVLRAHGFRTRHISLYSYSRAGVSRWRVWITPLAPSHAVSEVLTSRGWLVVDSTSFWLSLDANGNPVSMTELQHDVESKRIEWPDGSSPPPETLFLEPFTFLYGLYSRHGQFYPPFNSVPDIEWSEFTENLLSSP